MRKLIKLVAMLMVFCSLFCVFEMPIKASAASNACALVKGDGDDYNRWITFIVQTGKKSAKINFTQTKGIMAYGDGTGLDSKTYGAYTIEVINQKTGKSEKVYWKYTSNYTLKLDKNTTYTIKVKAYTPTTIGKQQNLKTSTSFITNVIRWLCGVKPDHSQWYWEKAPTWKVKSTSYVNWCHDFG